MPRKVMFVLVVAGALAAGSLGRSAAVSGAPATSQSEATELRQRVAALESARGPDGETRNAVSPGGRLVTLDERQAAQDRRIAALEASVAVALKQIADDAASAPAETASDETDEDRELRRLRGLATPALLAEIRTLCSSQWRTQDEQTAGNRKTMQACDVALGRRIETPRRAEVLTMKGIAYRQMGDFDKAGVAMHEALSLVRPESDEGVTAATQIAFNASLRYDCRSAAEQFLAISLLPGVAAATRAQMRYRAAGFFVAARDPERGRAEYRAVIDEFAASDDKSARYFADESRREIEKLDHPGEER